MERPPDRSNPAPVPKEQSSTHNPLTMAATPAPVPQRSMAPLHSIKPMSSAAIWPQIGVFTAAVIVSAKNEAPFALLPADSGWPAMWAGLIAFAGLTYALYAWVRRRAAKV